jgi:hypothetical protein
MPRKREAQKYEENVENNVDGQGRLDRVLTPPPMGEPES